LNQVFKRIYASVGANMSGQAITIFIQLASVPIFLSYWSLETYGQWLMLTALPTYFALSDFGFLTVIVNRMTIFSGEKNTAKVKSLFHSAIFLCLVINTFALLAVIATVFVVDVGVLSNLDNKLALILLVNTAVLSLSSRLIDAVFRSQEEYALGVHILNAIRLFEWCLLIAGLITWGSFFAAAACLFLGRVIGLYFSIFFAQYRHRYLTWSIKKASKTEIEELIKPALAFMSFPVSNAMLFQGMTLIIGTIFGPAYLVMFNTYRTVSRIIVQGVNVIASSVGPELSRQFGEGNFSAVNIIHNKGRKFTIALATISCCFLMMFGQELLYFWLGDKLEYNHIIFLGFVLAAFLNAIWYMEMVYLTSLNRHGEIAKKYLLTSIFIVFVLFVVGESVGGIAPVLLLSFFEIIIGYWCFKSVHKYKTKNISKGLSKNES